MKYSKPEIEIIEINAVDVIATSGEDNKPSTGPNGGPVVEFSTGDYNNYWGK